jgi:endogenous inhibitor of DNA gyrase (YacG/DUF329 family)
MLEPARIEKSRAAIKLAIVAAANKRHADPAWSSQINRAAGMAMAAKLAFEPKRTFQCIHCGSAYKTHPSSRKRGFCSPACQTAARWASGVDDEIRACRECGRTFRSNKYARTVYCSRRCGGIAAARTRLQHHGR